MKKEGSLLENQEEKLLKKNRLASRSEAQGRIRNLFQESLSEMSMKMISKMIWKTILITITMMMTITETISMKII